MGEWGGWVDEEHDKTGENRHWLQELRDYMIDKHIHHTFWCFNENSSDTGGLMYDNFQKWDDQKYEFIEPALWQDNDGKFISLDHTIPLGRAGNGISLSDYYSGGQSQETTASTTSMTATSSDILYGDANCDDKVDISDAVMVLQALSNKDKYGLNGTDPTHITEQGMKNADCNLSRDGVTTADALAIQKAVLQLITLPLE